LDNNRNFETRSGDSADGDLTIAQIAAALMGGAFFAIHLIGQIGACGRVQKNSPINTGLATGVDIVY